MSEITLNGRMRGRAAPNHPTTTLPSGYTVQVRRLASGTMAALRTQAYKELEPERPQPPVQEVEIAPGETRTVERTNDPDYAQALARWNGRVNVLTGQKTMKLLADYAIMNETEAEAVTAYREAMAAVGLDVTEETDREIYCWAILAPTQADQQALLNFVTGRSEPQPEAVQAHKETFRNQLPGESPT
jgi:hypothetical protein